MSPPSHETPRAAFSASACVATLRSLAVRRGRGRGGQRRSALGQALGDVGGAGLLQLRLRSDLRGEEKCCEERTARHLFGE